MIKAMASAGYAPTTEPTEALHLDKNGNRPSNFGEFITVTNQQAIVDVIEGLVMNSLSDVRQEEHVAEGLGEKTSMIPTLDIDYTLLTRKNVRTVGSTFVQTTMEMPDKSTTVD